MLLKENAINIRVAINTILFHFFSKDAIVVDERIKVTTENEKTFYASRKKVSMHAGNSLLFAPIKRFLSGACERDNRNGTEILLKNVNASWDIPRKEGFGLELRDVATVTKENLRKKTDLSWFE